MSNSNIFKNQEQLFIHVKLNDDLAYQYSIKNNDAENMQIVLRAWGEDFDLDTAKKQIRIAQEIEFDATGRTGSNL